MEDYYVGQVLYLPDSNMIFKIDKINKLFEQESNKAVYSYCYIDTEDLDINNLDKEKLAYIFENTFTVENYVKYDYSIENDDLMHILTINTNPRFNSDKIDFTEKYLHLFTERENTINDKIDHIYKLLTLLE